MTTGEPGDAGATERHESVGEITGMRNGLEMAQQVFASPDNRVERKDVIMLMQAFEDAISGAPQVLMSDPVCAVARQTSEVIAPALLITATSRQGVVEAEGDQSQAAHARCPSKLPPALGADGRGSQTEAAPGSGIDLGRIRARAVLSHGAQVAGTTQMAGIMSAAGGRCYQLADAGLAHRVDRPWRQRLPSRLMNTARLRSGLGAHGSQKERPGAPGSSADLLPCCALAPGPS